MSLLGAACTLMGEDSTDITEKYKKFLMEKYAKDIRLICDKYDYLKSVNLSLTL